MAGSHSASIADAQTGFGASGPAVHRSCERRTYRRSTQHLFVDTHMGALNLGRRVRRRLADERGQGTVEYVGLILLVSMLMVGMVVAMRGFNKHSA